MARAVLIIHNKRVYRDGAVAEQKIWRVPSSVRGSVHEFKHSLYYGRNGVRLVGYDNEAGKGDHRHYGDVEGDYPFTGIRKLLADYAADVRRLRSRRRKA